MAERPLLILPEPAPANKAKRGGGGGGPKPLGQIRQKKRIGPRLDELEAAFAAKRLTLQTTTSGLLPEDVLILETAGPVEDFFKAVSKIDGLEALGEYDEDDIPPDDDFFVDKKGVRQAYRGRVYLMFANQQAFQQLLRLWRSWQRGEKLEHGLTKWRDAFSLLRDIRPWSVSDRLEETGVLENWEFRLEWEKDKQLPCDIELWFRRDEKQRIVGARHVRSLVEELGGQVLSEAAIPDIHYHALAVRLPPEAVEALLADEDRSSVALVNAEQIQFFRAAGQMAGRVAVDQTTPLLHVLDGPIPEPSVDPVVALLDGLPLQSHMALAGRLSIDDPDDFAAKYEARHRIHGTAMASLIIWGDLHSVKEPIPEPLYVRPIMQPFVQVGWEDQTDERIPERILIVDLIHRAVIRMFDGDGTEPPSAPNVAVINLSIGIADRPFDGTLSPLARLLDWLSWKYNVLFLVSAGNHHGPVELGHPWSELSSLSESEIAEGIVKAVASDARHRRLLSPAEGMNVLTVAALHDDDDRAAVRPSWLDAAARGFPSPINAQGQGYKRSIKPDVLAPGGRISFVRPMLESDAELALPRVTYGPGQLVATPGSVGGDVTATAPTRGTSNATALMSRAAAFLVPVLDELRELEGGESLETVPDAVWLKALLVHGARWGDAGAVYEKLLKTPENSRQFTEYVTRLLGFGGVDLDAVRECTERRVTALAGGSLAADVGAEHRFPLPPSLSGELGRRHLVVTLAWMTPIHPLHHKWRRAHLWFKTPTSKLTIGSKKHLEREGANWLAAQRGTVQHEVFAGEKAAAFVDGDDIVVHVSCREDAGVFGEAVPYALVVTLEIDESIEIDIYTEVRDRVQNRLRVSPAG